MSDPDALAARLDELLASHLPRRPERLVHGEGDDGLVGSALEATGTEARDLARAREHARLLFDAGLGWPTGPEEYGGAGLDAADVGLLHEVAARYDVPDMNPLLVGQHIVAPAVHAHGTDEQRRRWLPEIFRGDVVGCQLFSEPGAGSDLGSLRTRAVREEGGWRVDGQKVWSSGAHLADIGELLVRTDPDPASRARGLTVMILDMRAAGVTVRPIAQMNDGAHFCEVFLDGVHVPDADVLGPVGEGWRVATTSLASERVNFGDESVQLFRRLPERLLLLGERHDAWDDSALAEQLGDAWARKEALAALPDALASAPPAVAAVSASIIKLAATDADRRVAMTAAEVLGMAASVDNGAWGEYAWSRVLLGMHAPRIAGGTDEIQLDIVSTHGLGLPR